MTEGGGRLRLGAVRGRPNWPKLTVPDLSLGQEFYGALFGWEYEELKILHDVHLGVHGSFLNRGQWVASITQHPEPDVTEGWWNVYFAVEECDRTVERTVRAGGLVAAEPADLADLGRSAILVDSVGAEFGLWQGRTRLGVQTGAGPGTASWFELLIHDTAAARGFYTSVFGYVTTPLELPAGALDLDYWTFLDGGVPVAGLHLVPDTVQSRWTIYFEVTDLDAAMRIAVERDGAVVRGPWDSPYGRLAVLSDPFDANFSVVQHLHGMPPR
ncbi:VOC family protein [Actinomadura craniellae]|uniref:VOC family protein n=1 Tax=Actinomadura craniellae TaxID=2231787 RepID=A0A365H4I1_9ACTN|nr:VOC family protein [Actinomadura craniellae]RAY13928.1 VOC family protein [Actinomadura craniellae]